MHKFFAVLFVLSFFVISGCDDKKVETAPIKPTDIISKAEVEKVLDGADVILEHGAVVDLGNNVYKASYLPNPLGSGDPVYVTVMYPSNNLSANEIKKIYTDSYSVRDNKKKIRGIGDGAFVAFPSLNIYEDGHLIKITAGSGDTQQQLDLLLELGQIAVKNLHTYLDNN